MWFCRGLALALCLISAFTLPSNAAADPEPLRVVVLGADRSELRQRLEGQLADTEWVVLVAPLLKHVSRAEIATTGARLGALAAVWFERSADDGWSVFVLNVDRSELIQREVSGPSHGEVMAMSARDELAAYIVREALIDLQEGRFKGTAVEVDARGPPAISPVAPPPRSRIRTSFSVGAGWQAVADGESPSGQQGPRLSFAVRHGRLGAWMSGATSLPVMLEDDLSSIELLRSDAMLGVSAELVQWGSLSLSALLGGGVVAFQRSTESRSSVVLGSKDRTFWSPAFRGTLSQSFELGSSGLSATVAAGADYVPVAPTFHYDSATGRVPRNRLSTVEPVAAIGLEFRFSVPDSPGTKNSLARSVAPVPPSH